MKTGWNSYFAMRVVDCEDCDKQVEINAYCDGDWYEGNCPICGTVIEGS